MMKNWTQHDLRFWNNNGSKRSKNNEKGGQQHQKSRIKLVQNAWKLSNDRFCLKIWPTVCTIISRTKCERDKQISFCKKVGVNKMEFVMKRGPNEIWKCQQRGLIPGKFPTTFKYGSAPSGCDRQSTQNTIRCAISCEVFCDYNLCLVGTYTSENEHEIALLYIVPLSRP